MALEQSPEKSTRRAAEELGLSQSTIYRILKTNKTKAYKVQILQALNEEEVDRRLEFAESQLEIMRNRDDYLDLLIFSDEAIFTVDGRVNKQKYRFWCDENPNSYTTSAFAKSDGVVRNLER